MISYLPKSQPQYVDQSVRGVPQSVCWCSVCNWFSSRTCLWWSLPLCRSRQCWVYGGRSFEGAVRDCLLKLPEASLILHILFLHLCLHFSLNDPGFLLFWCPYRNMSLIIGCLRDRDRGYRDRIFMWRDGVTYLMLLLCWRISHCLRLESGWEQEWLL